jgi:hypothetical protein
MDLFVTHTQDSEVQIITAPPLISTLYKSPQHPLSLFPTCCVFINRSLSTASDSGDSSASHAIRFHLHSLPCRTQFSSDNWLTNLVAPIVFHITTLHRLSRKRLFNSNSIVMCVFTAAVTCSRIRCLETGCITPLFIRLLHSNGCTCYNTNLHLSYRCYGSCSEIPKQRNLFGAQFRYYRHRIKLSPPSASLLPHLFISDHYLHDGGMFILYLPYQSSLRHYH